MTDSIDVYWHPACLRHDTGEGMFEAGPSPLLAAPEPHPEGADRLRNCRSVLERGPLAGQLRWHDGRLASLEELQTVHTAGHLDRVQRRLQSEEVVALDAQTYGTRESWTAALAAAGSALEATAAVLDGRATTSYALVRPPGHHAAPDRFDGYCLFNNLALAAQSAIDAGRRRVAIIDWDVHHGNGTQTCFYGRDDVLTISIHMDHRSWGPNHPEDGLVGEIGVDAGEGYNVNVALPFGCGPRAYADAFERVVGPALDRYRPELLFGASGQDANQFDPNGRQCLTMSGFRAIGIAMRDAAAKHTGGGLMMTHEGGYARTYSGLCLAATLGGVLGGELELDDPMGYPIEEGDGHRSAVRAAEARLDLIAGPA